MRMRSLEIKSNALRLWQKPSVEEGKKKKEGNKRMNERGGEDVGKSLLKVSSVTQPFVSSPLEFMLASVVRIKFLRASSCHLLLAFRILPACFSFRPSFLYLVAPSLLHRFPFVFLHPGGAILQKELASRQCATRERSGTDPNAARRVEKLQYFAVM